MSDPLKLNPGVNQNVSEELRLQYVAAYKRLREARRRYIDEVECPKPLTGFVSLTDTKVPFEVGVLQYNEGKEFADGIDWNDTFKEIEFKMDSPEDFEQQLALAAEHVLMQLPAVGDTEGTIRKQSLHPEKRDNETPEDYVIRVKKLYLGEEYDALETR